MGCTLGSDPLGKKKTKRKDYGGKKDNAFLLKYNYHLTQDGMCLEYGKAKAKFHH